MTPQEFRANPLFRDELSTIVSNHILVIALDTIASRFDGADAPLEAPEVASVRLHSQIAARHQFVTELLELAEPLPKEEKEQPMTFGTQHSVEEFDQAPV